MVGKRKYMSKLRDNPCLLKKLIYSKFPDRKGYQPKKACGFHFMILKVVSMGIYYVVIVMRYHLNYQGFHVCLLIQPHQIGESSLSTNLLLQ